MSEFARIPVYALDLDLVWCGNTYGVAPCAASGAAGSECYQGYRHCQDKANFTATTKTIAICSTGAPIPPGEIVRPYITKGGVEWAATEIDPRAGLAPRSSCTVTAVDEPCPDHDLDPYHATRATPATGTYWSRLLARFYLSNVRARISRAYFTDGWDSGEFVTESYIVDTVKGPSSKGEVKIVLKDTIKLADRTKLPAPTTGKLAVALGTNDLSMTLETGDGAQYAASGYVRVKNQVIQYTSNVSDVLSWPDSSYRSKFDTTAESADIGEVVQQCLVYLDNSFTEVCEDLLNRSGIADANIDIAGIQFEDDTWLAARYRIKDCCLHDPESASAYFAELGQQTGGVFWWDPVAAKVKYKFIGPQSPLALVGNTLTDEANIIGGSVEVSPLDDLRLTRAYIGFNLANATANVKEGKNFLGGRGYIDAAAESAFEYGDVRQDVMYSRWFRIDQNALGATAFVKRRVGHYRDAPLNITVRVDAKDAAVREGDIYDVTTKQIVDETGATRTVRCLVIRRKDNGKGLDLTLRTTNFARRYGFIAPNGTSNYPANSDYACICLNTGLFSDGSGGYLII